MAGIRFAIKGSATVLMQLSAPHAAELQQPTLSTAYGDAQNARVHRDFDFGYSVVSHVSSPAIAPAGRQTRCWGDRLFRVSGGRRILRGRFLVVVAGLV
jgi:hypothetical protein